MDINEVCRAVVLRDQEEQRKGTTGQARIILDYADGKIRSARYETSGHLLPGSRKAPPQMLDTDSRGRHGG